MKKFNLKRLAAFALVAVLGVCGFAMNANATNNTDASAYCIENDALRAKIEAMVEEAAKSATCVDKIDPEKSTFVAFVPTAAKVVMYDGAPHGLNANVYTTICKDFVQKATILYVGVTEDGTIYQSVKAPTKVGYYYAVAMYAGCCHLYPSVAYGTVVIVPKPVTVAFDGTKELTGRDMYNGEFEFALLGCDGKVIDTTSNKEDGSFAFDGITYYAPGVYNYKVVENNTESEYVTYDESVYNVKVVVTIKCGKLVADTFVCKDGKAVDEMVFVNEYEKPVPPTVDPEDPTPEDPKPEDPTPEDPKPEDPKPEDPKPQDPKPEEPEIVGPKTGDATNYMVYLMLAAVSVVCALAAMVYKRR